MRAQVFPVLDADALRTVAEGSLLAGVLVVALSWLLASLWAVRS